MITQFDFIHGVDLYRADLTQGIDCNLPIKEGDDNPNCYYAESPVFQTIRSGDFIGSVAEGGSVNYQKISLTPHGNGTHTECYGHISADGATIFDCHRQFFALCKVLSIEPRPQGGDHIITLDALKAKWPRPDLEALAIRSLPNDEAKRRRKYSGTNPPYLSHELTGFLADYGVQHLLVDLPSVDREVDGGSLLAHKAFWNYPIQIRKEATITELIYIPDNMPDGVYLLNLQTMPLLSDASPSRVLLYPVKKLTYAP
jgi:arylformamidase